MSPRDKIMLLALANEWDRRSAAHKKRADRKDAFIKRKKTKTTDADWDRMNNDYGTSYGLGNAAAQLRHKIRYMETSPRLNRKRK